MSEVLFKYKTLTQYSYSLGPSILSFFHDPILGDTFDIMALIQTHACQIPRHFLYGIQA